MAELVRDGDTVALEGFTHLIPFAAGHEIIRQGRRDLTLVRMTPDLDLRPADRRGLRREAGLLLGRQPRRRLAAPLARRRSSHGWPAPLQIEEHSHAGMANRYVAGASGLPFAVLRGYAGTDLPHAHRDDLHRHLPVHRRGAGRRAGAQPGRHRRPRPARRPARQRAAVGHHRRAEGGVLARDAVAGHRRGDRRRARRRCPARWCCRTGWSTRSRWRPAAPRPSYAQGYYDRDNAAYRAWDAISRDRDAFTPAGSTEAGRDDRLHRPTR